MSKQAHLPPKSPSQNKGLPFRAADSRSLIGPRITGLCGRHQRSPSQSSLIDEQPSWLDDLLSDSEMNGKGVFHRRSASDSVAYLVDLSSFPKLTSSGEEGNSICSEACHWSIGSRIASQLDQKDDSIPIEYVSLQTKQPKHTEASSDLEAACIYGPNSPRLRFNLTDSEGSKAPSLSKEYVPRNHPFQYSVDNVHSYSAEICHSDAKGDDYGAYDHLDAELKGTKRHSGQRSRVRKLQYIAELERTVDVFRTLESELAAKVASLFQQRVILTVENTTLKQQMASVLQEKMIKDGQYQSLKSEVERLKMAQVHRLKSKDSSYFRMNSTQVAIPETNWQILDMGKLSLS